MSRTIPPFERLYHDVSPEILRHLRRLLQPQDAEDAFQETFLRALRAYPKLRSGANLRAWLYTIALHVAFDHRRRGRARSELPELATLSVRPSYAEIEHLTNDLPPTERAAVVLRYGYDLSYSDIALALGSSEQAARQAASSGIRRLRRKELT